MSYEPKYMSDKFKCPHCNVIAQQRWFNSYQFSNVIFNIYEQIFLDYRVIIRDYAQEYISKFLNNAKTRFPNEINSVIPRNCSIAVCESCNLFSMWVDEKIVFPRHVPVDPPNTDLNEEIKSLYIEASNIFLDSPKGATALLRLALQKLLIQIGKDGKNINNDIKELVAEGLNPKIQKALDLVRVVGNNAVHPGEINLDDNSDIALKLFKIINMISEEFITKPKEIDSLYNNTIPDEIKEHINKRDGKTG
jgi:hypothetical protein